MDIPILLVWSNNQLSTQRFLGQAIFLVHYTSSGNKSTLSNATEYQVRPLKQLLGSP